MPTDQSQSPALVVSVGVQCHVGKQRTENQDRVTRAATPFGDLFVVADGVGGYQGGAEAAQTTVDGLVSYLNSHANLLLADALQGAVRSVRAELQRRSDADQALRGMGSTVVLCVVSGNTATYAHAGDSRLYLVRDRQLKQLTRDHSVMERLISQGILTPAQAREHPDASVLTRAIGQAADVILDIAEIILQPDDALLLCSDGLWGYTQAEEMAAVATSGNLSASAAAEALLNLALEGGGGDNISIQFLRFNRLEPPEKTKPNRRGSKFTIPAIALAAIIASGTAGLSLWNQRHAISQNSAASAQPAATPARNQATQEVSKPAVPSNPPPAPHAQSAPNKTAAHPAKVKSRATPATPAHSPDDQTAQTGDSQSAEPAQDANPKTDVWIIVEKDGDTVTDWRSQLNNQDFLNPSQHTGSEECIKLERSSAVLLYTNHSEKIAKNIQTSISLPPAAIARRSKEELKKCGDNVELVALPAKSSRAGRIADKTTADAQATVGKIKTVGTTVQQEAEKRAQEAKDKVKQQSSKIP